MIILRNIKTNLSNIVKVRVLINSYPNFWVSPFSVMQFHIKGLDMS